MRPTPFRLALLASVAMLQAGCASLQPEQALEPVQTLSRQQLHQTLSWQRSEAERSAAQAEAQALLQAPLDLAGAQRVALLMNPGLQAALHGLDIAEAERVQLLRWPNPGLSLGRLQRGSETETEIGLHLNLLSWLQQGRREQLAQAQLAQAQQLCAQALLAQAHLTRLAWIEAVAAEQWLQYSTQVMNTAQAAAELAQQLQKAGNVSALREARELVFLSEAQQLQARAQEQVLARREALIRALGLRPAQQASLRLPTALPPLPETPARAEATDAMQALTQRVDVLAAQRRVQALGVELDLSRPWTRTLELGLQHSRSNEQPSQHGPSLSLELPLFDRGEARLARVDAQQRQAIAQVEQVLLQAQSELREAQARLLLRHQIALRAQQQLPLHQRIAQESLLRYNGMLGSVFELLSDTRAQIAGVAASQSALRDYWLADAAWQQARLGPAIAPLASSEDAWAPEPARGSH